MGNRPYRAHRPEQPPQQQQMSSEQSAPQYPELLNKDRPIIAQPTDSPSANNNTRCPMEGKTGKAYDVYGRPLDPNNRMPAVASQTPAPGQRAPLSTDRVESTIPKGGTELDKWTYPSAQMFWNALVRKAKVEGAQEGDMDVVVAIHNNMNENTWRKVIEWEEIHKAHDVGRGVGGLPSSRLSRFLGRPDELSPKAWIKGLFGHPRPFDRHDWIVERVDGSEVRYVIDYYHDDEAARENKVPTLHDFSAVKSIALDVRPALDSADAFVDRFIRMPYYRFQGRSPFQPLPFLFKPHPISPDRDRVLRLGKQVQEKCQEQKRILQKCTGEASCSRAAIALNYCMAELLCKPEAQAFRSVFDASGGEGPELEGAYDRMAVCLSDFEKKVGANR